MFLHGELTLKITKRRFLEPRIVWPFGEIKQK